MREATEHKAYELLKDRYERVCLDYVILGFDGKYEGFETHKNAVIEAFGILNERFGDDTFGFTVECEKMTAEKIDFRTLLDVADDVCISGKKNSGRAYTIPSPLTYSFAFLNPPSGTPYGKSDFTEFNDILFPRKDSLDIYRFGDDFSNYFDEGKEWWGTGLWSAFDAENRLFIIIGASLTD